MQTVTSEDRLLTAIEVAERLAVSPGSLSVWRCTKRYELPYIKVGRSVRYRESAVQKFLESRTHNCELVTA